jgi:ABC-2 type transport system ATP-binding protein
MSDRDPVLQFESVSKRFGPTLAVDSLSFSVAPGQIYGFLGPNGAGKTTSLRMALGVLAPDSGGVSVFGAPPTRDVLDRVGFLPEERGIYKRMTAEAAIVFFATLKSVDARTARARAQALLTQFGLGDVMRRKLKTFSKGMAQKVQILASIAHEPDLVILDEPFSGLDPVNQQGLEGLIRGLADSGKTVLFSTHVMQHAERLCDRIVLVARGRKAFEGSVAEALAVPPAQVIVETEAGVDAAAIAASIGASAEPDAAPRDAPDSARWIVRLPRGGAAHGVLHAFVSAGAPLRRFEPSRPTLHEAFVRLVGEADAPPQTEADEAAA